MNSKSYENATEYDDKLELSGGRMDGVHKQKNSNHGVSSCSSSLSTKSPLMLVNLRKPLNSPSQKVSSNGKYNLSTRESQSLPAKQCFSQEALDLSRHQITVTKRSKVDISLIPPKRIRMDGFEYSRKTITSESRHHVRHLYSSTSSVKRTELSRPRPPQPLRSNVISGRSNRDNKLIISKDRNKGHPCNTAVSVGDGKASFFLVSMKSFPEADWKENNYDVQMLKEMMFLYESEIIPVTLAYKDGQTTVIHESNIASSDALVGRLPCCTKKSSFLYELVKLPFMLPIKVISGVVKWVIGD